MRRSTAHLYATGLFLASLIAPFLATPDVLREDVLRGLLVATPLVAVASLIPGSTDGRTSSGHADLWVTGVAGLALTGVYWWRASLGISSFGEGLGFEIGRTFVFWVPAVLFACLYRSPGEGWLPSGRGRLLLRMTTAFFGAALGVTLQVATLDAYRDRVDARPQDEAVALLQAEVAGPEGAQSRSAAPALVIRTHSTSR